jgi:branched-chain amino acid transport system ATP-binding protein
MLLRVERLRAFYGKSQVLFDVDLEADGGEVVTILGRNGVGKTSTLLAIMGVIKAEAASLRLAGEEIGRLPTHKRARAGLSIVPSGSRSFPSLTVDEVLSLVPAAPTSGRHWSTGDVMDLFPVLRRLRNSRAGTLSGGERQMLAVGKALLANPSALLLDEPSEGLAPRVVREVGDILRELCQEGLAVVLTEQNHRLALRIADRAYFLQKGTAVWTGTTEAALRPGVVDLYLGVGDAAPQRAAGGVK